MMADLQEQSRGASNYSAAIHSAVRGLWLGAQQAAEWALAQILEGKHGTYQDT